MKLSLSDLNKSLSLVFGYTNPLVIESMWRMLDFRIAYPDAYDLDISLRYSEDAVGMYFSTNLSDTVEIIGVISKEKLNEAISILAKLKPDRFRVAVYENTSFNTENVTSVYVDCDCFYLTRIIDNTFHEEYLTGPKAIQLIREALGIT